MKAKDQTKEAAVNPLVEDNKKLIPSVTRVFSKATSTSSSRPTSKAPPQRAPW